MRTITVAVLGPGTGAVRFESPFALLALLLVPLALVGYVWLDRCRAHYAIRFTNIEVLEQVSVGAPRWRPYVPVAFVLLALTCAIAALSRPQRSVSTTNEQTSIVLAVDASASMAADDVKPTRLAAADEAIRRFLAIVPKRYRVGLVAFSDEPYVATPLTWDRDLVFQALGDVNAGQGTAIGDALVRSVALLAPLSRYAESATSSAVSTAVSRGNLGAPSAILFLSDGAQTSGKVSPLAGAARALSDGIPVDTIALGTTRGVVRAGVMSLPVPPDRTLLRQIAVATGGEFFAPTDEQRLNAVYEHLASRLGRTHHWQGLDSGLEGLAAVFTLIAGALALLQEAPLP